jgi:hypothetical protein
MHMQWCMMVALIAVEYYVWSLHMMLLLATWSIACALAYFTGSSQAGGTTCLPSSTHVGGVVQSHGGQDGGATCINEHSTSYTKTWCLFATLDTSFAAKSTYRCVTNMNILHLVGLIISRHMFCGKTSDWILEDNFQPTLIAPRTSNLVAKHCCSWYGAFNSSIHLAY